MSLPAELQIDEHRFLRLVALAVEEDLAEQGDITTRISAATGPGAAGIVAGQDAVVCGLAIAPLVLEQFARALETDAPAPPPSVHAAAQVDFAPPTFEPAGISDGERVTAGMTLGTVRGNRSAILAAERTTLNFLQRLSGIATLTRQFVEAAGGAPAKIYDTRKTTPGWRSLEKYAVRCGGGHNHRRGLHDAILVKDNHLGGVPPQRLAQHAFDMLNRMHEQHIHPDFVEFEVDSLQQLEQLLKVVGIDVILLDNFSLEDTRRAVSRRNTSGLQAKVALEASGGITLETVGAIAQTGIERISIGALTHSARAVDLRLEWMAAP